MFLANFIIHTLQSKNERDIELCLKSEIHSSTNGKKSPKTQNRTIPKDNFIGWKNTSDFNDSGVTYLEMYLFPYKLQHSYASKTKR